MPARLAGFLLPTDIAADRCYDQAVAPHPSMSEEQLKAFLEKVKGDTNIQEKLKAAASPEAAIEIAKEDGFAITAEDIQSMPLSDEELSDEELEGAAGGQRPWTERPTWAMCQGRQCR